MVYAKRKLLDRSGDRNRRNNYHILYLVLGRSFLSSLLRHQGGRVVVGVPGARVPAGVVAGKVKLAAAPVDILLESVIVGSSSSVKRS